MSRHKKIEKLEREMLRIGLNLPQVLHLREYVIQVRRYNHLNSQYVQLTGEVYSLSEHLDCKKKRVVHYHD